MAAEWLSTGQLLWQMLQGLVNGYASQKRNFVRDHVDPLQDKVMEIHKDYISGFEETRRLLKDDTAPQEDLIEFLRARRRDYEMHRQLSRDLAEELGKTRRRVISNENWEAVEEYCRAVVDYFTEGALFAHQTWYTRYLNGVEDFTRRGADHVWAAGAVAGSRKHDLLDEADRILDQQLPRAFGRVSKAYAVLRRRLL